MAAGPVLIDETRCVGDETRLINCRHNGIGTHNCGHSQDVGLRCVIRKCEILLFLNTVQRPSHTFFNSTDPLVGLSTQMYTSYYDVHYGIT